MSGDVVMLNHPIFSKKIFINFNKDILKPKNIIPTDDKTTPKSYRIPPRKYILKSRGDRFGYRGGQQHEDPLENNEYVYKSSRKDKIQVKDYIHTETNLDEEDYKPIRTEQKRITTLIQSIKRPTKSDLFLPAPPEKHLDIKQQGYSSPRAYLASDRLMMSPKANMGLEPNLHFYSPKSNKAPLYSWN